MAFTAALSYLSGVGRAKQTAADQTLRSREVEQQHEDRQQQLDQQKQEFDETHSYNQAQLEMQRSKFAMDTRASGIDPNTGQPLPPPVLPKQLTQIVPLNKGRGGAPGPQDNANHDLALADYYDSIGRPDLAAERRQTATQYGLGAQRMAAAGLSGARTTETLEGKLPLDRSQATLDDAKAAAERDLPARAREIAAGHDQGAWQRASAQIASHQLIAGYQGQTRVYLAQLGGAFMLKGKGADEAARAAIADYNGRVRGYLAKQKAQAALPTDAQTGTSQPFPTLPQPAATPVTINPGGLQPPQDPWSPHTSTTNGGDPHTPHDTPHITPNDGAQRVPTAQTIANSWRTNTMTPAQLQHAVHQLAESVKPGSSGSRDVQTAVNAIASGIDPIKVLLMMHARLTVPTRKAPASMGWGDYNGPVAPLPVPKKTSLAPLPVRNAVALQPLPVGGSNGAGPF